MLPLGGRPLEGEALAGVGAPPRAVVGRAGVNAPLLHRAEGDPRRDRAVHPHVHVDVGHEYHRHRPYLHVDGREHVLDDVLLVGDVLGDGGGPLDLHRLLHGDAEVHALYVYLGQDVAVIEEVVQGGPVHVDVHVEVGLEGKAHPAVEEEVVGVGAQLHVVESVVEGELHVGGVLEAAPTFPANPAARRELHPFREDPGGHELGRAQVERLVEVSPPHRLLQGGGHGVQDHLPAFALYPRHLLQDAVGGVGGDAAHDDVAHLDVPQRAHVGAEGEHQLFAVA